MELIDVTEKSICKFEFVIQINCKGNFLFSKQILGKNDLKISWLYRVNLFFRFSVGDCSSYSDCVGTDICRNSGTAAATCGKYKCLFYIT